MNAVCLFQVVTENYANPVTCLFHVLFKVIVISLYRWNSACAF